MGQLQYGRGRVLFAAATLVVWERVDEGGSVLRCPHQAFGLVDAVAALDRVQSEVQAAGDLE